MEIAPMYQQEHNEKKPAISISHAGFHVFDMDHMVEFFMSVYGFTVTDRGILGERGEITFLGADPRDHHQLVLYSGRTKSDAIHYNHISFRVGNLDKLREIHAALKTYPDITKLMTVNHGNAWSVYCHDPEGNRTEAFVDTPWYVSQPYDDKLDLTQSDAEIEAMTHTMLMDDPTTEPVETWREKYAHRLSLD
jgi:catechol 2,3-dioxygenase